jgi:fructose-1,6-bisphosphatase/sedoheptulose 1,7-bisphosphatase-like protein
VNIDEETKRKIIDLRNQHKKNIREIVEAVGKSSRDVTAVLKENEINKPKLSRVGGTAATLETVMTTLCQTSKRTSCFLKEKAL